MTRNILLVEDDENDVFFFKRAMKLAGWTDPLQVVPQGAEAVGPGVEHVKPGMRVTAIGMKTYAEYCLASGNQVIPLPDFVNFAEGAAFPIQTLTAYHMMYTSHQLTPGQTVLVHSAAGGVGIVAVQIAKAAGARVIATVSSAEKAERARAGGAAHIIDYRREDVAARILDITGGVGVDHIVEVDFGGNLAAALRAVSAESSKI
jgi:NADPH2:quinone reductase